MIWEVNVFRQGDYWLNSILIQILKNNDNKIKISNL